MVALPRFLRQCDEQFLVNEEYPLTILEARSRASHSHYFACIHENYQNLPEALKDKIPSEEHLRAWALVETGQCTDKYFVCDSPEHALSLGANIRERSPLCVITISGNVVRTRDAISQSASAMGKEQFDESKRKVLDYIAGLIGVKRSELEKAGAKHFKPKPRRR
jgi:hypothetical protein